MSVDTLLSAALSILSNGAAWTKGANARNAENKPVPILSATAVKWDVFGALKKAHADSGEPTFRNYQAAYGVMRSRIPLIFKSQDMEKFNDYSASFPDAAILFGGTAPITYIRVLTTEDGVFLTDENGNTFFGV